MPIVHFLNVGDGDCSIIEHISGRVSMIDVCKAEDPDTLQAAIKKASRTVENLSQPQGNFNQKANPENPIEYLRKRAITSIHRFILTHPDMDHMDGMRALFGAFEVINFWDTDNVASKEFADGSPYREEDWAFYTTLRDGKLTNPKRLALYAGATGPYYNQAPPSEGHDGLFVLAPTAELVARANESGDFNDSSYVVLYRTGAFRILFCGDTHDASWEHILANHEADVRDIDILIAPHHGRKSDRDFAFLDTLRPRLTLFGNAPSEHLAYAAWNQRELAHVTNNQAGTIVLAIDADNIRVLFTNETFAKKLRPSATLDTNLEAWEALILPPQNKLAA